MEILQRGKLPQEKVYQCVCRNCSTLFSFKREEANLIVDQRDGNSLKIKCPLDGCGTDCWVTP